MKIKEVVSALERFAPLPLQDGFDNAGLQVGLTEAEATGALLCLDVTEAVIDEAIGSGFNVIVAHHPLLFHGLKTLTGRNYIERCVMKAVKHGIVLYAAHTNLDNAPGGVSFKIAEKLGLQNVRFLEMKTDVPSDIRMEAGSGVMGEFEHPMTKDVFLKRVKETFEVECVRFNNWQGTVKKVALCGGAGSFLMDKAVAEGADAFMTGEIGYHDFFGREEDILLVETGHYESEQYTVELIESIIKEACGDLPVKKTMVRTNPINYM